MKKEQMQSFLDAWYRDRDEAPKDAHGAVSRVLARVPQTRQRSRWWPFPIFYRRNPTPTTKHTIEYQPSPISAADGHNPTVIGRPSSMLSPAKAITAGALVFAIGGALLIAQPFQQETIVPGAEVADQTTHYVFGTILHDYSDAEEQSTYPDGIDERQHIRSHGRVETQDARMTGDVTYDLTLDLVPVSDRPDRPAELSWADVTIETDDGRWEGRQRCVPVTPFLVNEGANPCFYELTGKDGYEGLSAMLAVIDAVAGDGEVDHIETYRLSGLIFAGNLPPDR